MTRVTQLFLVLGFLVIVPLLVAQQQLLTSIWALDASTLTYHISHLVHEVDGTSHQAQLSDHRIGSIDPHGLQDRSAVLPLSAD